MLWQFQVDRKGIQPSICIYRFSPKLPLPSRLPHNIEQRSLCYAGGTCWWSILNIAMCTFPGFPGGASDKESSCQCKRHETQGRFLGYEDPLEEGMASHPSTFVWRIPWTEEPGRLQSTGSQRVGHDWSNVAGMHAHVHVHPKLPSYGNYPGVLLPTLAIMYFFSLSLWIFCLSLTFN